MALIDLGSLSNGESSNAGLGWGVNSASSFEEGGSQNSSVGDSWGSSESWSHVYGSEASAKDIERAKEANLLTEQWMDKNLAFQEYMSNTAYQRQVEDMIKAGINPRALFYKLTGGATTPAGAMAQAQKATTFPDQDSYSYSESGSHNEGSGSSYNVGGSESNGINFNFNSGKSTEQAASGIAGLIKGLADSGGKWSGSMTHDEHDKIWY